MQSSEAIHKQEFSDSLPRASVQDLGVVLMGAGYEVLILPPEFFYLLVVIATCSLWFS